MLGNAGAGSRRGQGRGLPLHRQRNLTASGESCPTVRLRNDASRNGRHA
jgi:hypothetical protein